MDNQKEKLEEEVFVCPCTGIRTDQKWDLEKHIKITDKRKKTVKYGTN